jgi:ribosome maturation factor RimP
MHDSPDPRPFLASVRALVAPLCVAHGVELVDVAWGGRILRVTIERRNASGKEDPQGTSGWGVTLDDCAELSRDISRALDTDEDIIPGAYSLEVSSPGLERDLRTADDFRRFAGFLAKVKLDRPAPDGQRALRGRIEALDGAGATATLRMRVDAKDISVPFETVTTAHLVYELPVRASDEPSGRGPTRGQQRGSKAGRPKKDRRRVSQKGA